MSLDAFVLAHLPAGAQLDTYLAETWFGRDPASRVCLHESKGLGSSLAGPRYFHRVVTLPAWLDGMTLPAPVTPREPGLTLPFTLYRIPEYSSDPGMLPLLLRLLQTQIPPVATPTEGREVDLSALFDSAEESPPCLIQITPLALSASIGNLSTSGKTLSLSLARLCAMLAATRLVPAPEIVDDPDDVPNDQRVHVTRRGQP